MTQYCDSQRPFPIEPNRVFEKFLRYAGLRPIPMALSRTENHRFADSRELREPDRSFIERVAEQV